MFSFCSLEAVFFCSRSHKHKKGKELWCRCRKKRRKRNNLDAFSLKTVSMCRQHSIPLRKHKFEMLLDHWFLSVKFYLLSLLTQSLCFPSFVSHEKNCRRHDIGRTTSLGPSSLKFFGSLRGVVWKFWMLCHTPTGRSLPLLSMYSQCKSFCMLHELYDNQIENIKNKITILNKT